MVSIGFNFMDVDVDVEYMTCRGPLCCFEIYSLLLRKYVGSERS